jgi:hypothetical protein
MTIKNYALLAVALIAGFASQAQSSKKWKYDNNGTDQFIFSWTPTPVAAAAIRPRFSCFWTLNANMRRDFGKKMSFLAGVAIKNLGSKYYVTSSLPSNYVSVGRYYTVGIPLALRFGNIAKHKWFGIDGGFDVPFNYKQKSWTAGSKSTKVKSNTWFPAATNYFVPYVGASFSTKFGGVKFINYLRPFSTAATAESMRYVSLFLNINGKSAGTGAVRKKINLKSKTNTL